MFPLQRLGCGQLWSARLADAACTGVAALHVTMPRGRHRAGRGVSNEAPDGRRVRLDSAPVSYRRSSRGADTAWPANFGQPKGALLERRSQCP